MIVGFVTVYFTGCFFCHGSFHRLELSSWELLFKCFGHHQGNDGCGEKQETCVQKGQAIIAHLGKEAKDHGTETGCDSSKVIAESCACCSEKCGEEWRQIHREEAENTLT